MDSGFEAEAMVVCATQLRVDSQELMIGDFLFRVLKGIR